jgi:hypothetical protein
LVYRSADVNGALFTVNPIAIRQDINVYTENKRVVSEIHTPSFGTVVLVAVGATIVGSIHHLVEPGSNVTKGDQHGYFAFGGSTILVLFQVRCVCVCVCVCVFLFSFVLGGNVLSSMFGFVIPQPGTIQFDEDLLKNSQLPLETLCKVTSASVALWQ